MTLDGKVQLVWDFFESLQSPAGLRQFVHYCGDVLQQSYVS